MEAKGAGDRAFPTEQAAAAYQSSAGRPLTALGPGLPGGVSTEEFFSAVIRSFPDVTVFAFGPELRFVAVAGAALSGYGWSEGELLGKRPSELVRPTDGAVMEEAMRAALRGETRRHEQSGIKHPEAVWVNTVAPLRDAGGAVVGGLVVARDVATLRTAEEARRHLEDVAVSAARLAESERWRRERLEFLVEINDVLADCNDRRDVMREVTRAAVPRLGDWCTIHVLLDPRDREPEVEVAHVDPAMMAEARRIQRLLPFDPEAPSGIPQVLRTGRSLFEPDVDDGALVDLDLPPEVHEAVVKLAIRSCIAVPLVKRRRAVGAMQFMISSEDRRYTEDDLALAQAVAGRVASSLENRRLVELQRDIARTLQRSLLPEDLPEVPGADLAVRYWAAGEGNEVGGDFYDVFPSGLQTWSVVIGDVCGSGPAAASLTAMARHTIRANARRGDDEVTVLARLNEAMLGTWGESFCTVAYGTLRSDGSGFRFTVAAGGHPRPVLVRRGGDVSLVGRFGPLLGVFDRVEHHPTAVELTVGDTLVFYTDGATDLPPPHGLDEEELMGMVAGAVAGSTTAEAVADRLSRALDRHQPFSARHDDVALVVVKVGPPA